MIFDSLPSQFRLRDICAITGRVCELRVNAHQEEAERVAYAWFNGVGLCDDSKQSTYLGHRGLGLAAALSFPDVDLKHLTTCLIYYLWAFSTDDWADEGDVRSNPDDLQTGHGASLRVVENPDGPRPEYPYAAMLYDLVARIRETSTPGAYKRFVRGFKLWCIAQATQSRNRSQDRVLSVEEFILMRQGTYSCVQTHAIVEYSIDVDLPDEVFENPTFKAMYDAVSDLMAWPNVGGHYLLKVTIANCFLKKDLCSFNKEQLNGDYQNLVFCIMHEHNVGLQAAIDILTNMLERRVEGYIELKNQLPSFGSKVDRELEKYVHALENLVQGTALWYYLSPRYFHNVDVTNRENLVVPLFKSDTTW